MMAARNLMFGVLASLSLLPATAPAQERRPMTRPKVYFDTTEMGNVPQRFKFATQRRARLGVTVDLQASANDSVGATLESVTPGGPAAKAGLKSGDVITKLDGKSLTATAGEKPGMDESLPGLRLVEIASQLKPKDTVSVEYRREGVRKTVSLVTGDEPLMSFAFPGEGIEHGMIMGPEGRMRIERMLPKSGSGHFEFGPGGGDFAFAYGGPLMDLELAPLNSDLGQYFGTSEGVLVISVPKESSLGVKGGDVILTIDGRRANSPSSLLRIMRSYDPGESFKLELMRNKSRMTVTGKLDKPREE